MIDMLKRLVTAAVGAALATLLQTTPANALTSDQAALVQLTNQYVTNAPGSSQAYVSGMAIYGSWALVGWTDNVNSGGEIIASKASGSWVISRAAGGAYSSAELQSVASVDSTSASFLIANLRPLAPAGGPTANASGASTYTDWVQYCPTGSQGSAVRQGAVPAVIGPGGGGGGGIPPGTTPNAFTSPDTALTFQTGSVSPTSIGQAVTIDLSVSAGTAVVTLFSPSGQTVGTSSIPAGATGGVGYWNPLAPGGVYQFTITGTSVPFGSSCGTPIKTTRIVTDAAWTGALAW
jgi:hypothetical protein